MGERKDGMQSSAFGHQSSAISSPVDILAVDFLAYLMAED